MILFPQGQYRWAKIGSKEVKSVVKEDLRQYTDDIPVYNHTQYGRGCCVCTPNLGWETLVKFSVSPNHWANLTTKIEFAKFMWNWVVEEHMKDAEKEGRELSREEAEATARCVWLLDCW